MTPNPVLELRHRLARRSVIFHYAAEHDRYAEQEQIDAHLLALGLIDEAEYLRVHDLAALYLRAYVAEMDNVKPEGLGA